MNNPIPEARLGPSCPPSCPVSHAHAVESVAGVGFGGNRACEIIIRKLGTLGAQRELREQVSMNSMLRPRPSLLPQPGSTMTPRLHGNPLAALPYCVHCN
ncbi:hypothetical protein DHEL01_v208149 [Diaporthe helianthi]|uniref:Uncharacterized protein n=1 Tax=Diaporthe helianthi TaxID=158607 RepID=A0A2P5HT81_DIAHE|nr:hypothetical protein DHEL01_v208149 [Diaporthe helianthi]